MNTNPLGRLLLIAALSLVAVGPSGASTTATVPGAESDVRLLAQQLEAIHPDLFAGVSRARFRSAVESAAAQADELSENELLVELMRLAALPGTGNGHTGIFPGDPQHRRDLHFYPLRLYAFGDGTYVVDEKGKDGLVGARVTAVGGVPYAEVAKRVRPLVPHDNASNLQGLLPHYVLSAEVLDGLGIADGVSSLELTFAQGGRSRTVTLSPVSAPSYVATFHDPIHGHYPSLLPRRKPAPLYLRRSASLLWVGPLDRGRAVFVGFNSVQRPSYTLVERITKLSRRPQVKRVIVDLRLNGGGNNQTYSSLLGALSDSSVNRRGRLFVLIGRATFSAAANFAADVDRLTKARFVGEPTGGFVRGYGDTAPVLLPKSGINVRIAARYWDFGKGSTDRRLAINPDRWVKVTIADFLAGRDPVLAAALK
jgi:Peptidase family S41